MRCAVLALWLGGCANFSTLQEAETVPAKKAKLGIGAAFNRYPVEFKEETIETLSDGTQTTTITTDSESFTLPTLAGWLRYGLTDRLEIHGMAWFPLGLSAGGKYMLIGERDEHGFVLSPGLDITMPITISLGDDDETYRLTDIYVPIHGGYRFNDAFEVYVTPKYLLRLVNLSAGHAAGSTLGIALGKHTQLLLEGGVFYDLTSGQPIINGGLGFAFD